MPAGLKAADLAPSTLDDSDVAANPATYDSATDPEMEGLTLYEKKCVLINREMDANGMGKYQWYIWFLTGFGYFVDLLWAQAFGLVLGPLEQELGFSGSQSGNISTSFSAGLTAGEKSVLTVGIGRHY